MLEDRGCKTGSDSDFDSRNLSSGSKWLRHRTQPTACRRWALKTKAQPQACTWSHWCWKSIGKPPPCRVCDVDCTIFGAPKLPDPRPPTRSPYTLQRLRLQKHLVQAGLNRHSHAVAVGHGPLLDVGSTSKEQSGKVNEERRNPGEEAETLLSWAAATL